MMKSKKSTYLLIILVLGVWGAVAYKIFSHIRKGDDTEQVYNFNNSKVDEVFATDTQIVLSLNYPDPFLKGSRHNAGGDMRTVSTKVNIRERIDPLYGQNTQSQVVWPEIIYSGIVRNKKTNEALGLVQITNSSQLMRPGQDFGGVRLLELYSDSIRLNFQNQKKTIRKN